MGPWPMTSTVSSGARLSSLTPLSTVLTRLDKRGLLEGHAVGNADHAAVGDHEVHDADVLGKAAAGRLEAAVAPVFL